MRAVSGDLWRAAAVLTAWLIIDQVIMWAWLYEFDDSWAETIGTNLSIPGALGWGRGWRLLLGGEMPLEEGPIFLPDGRDRLVASYWPMLVLAIILGGAVGAKAVHRKLALPRSIGAAARPVARTLATARPVTQAGEGRQRWLSWTQMASVITALAAVGALLFTALALQETRKQIEIAAEDQIAGRYAQAVQLLAAPGTDGEYLRLGGVYSLARISADSSRDSMAIAIQLASFVRAHARRPADRNACPLKPPADIQAALAVLKEGNINIRMLDGLDLSNICLRGADLSGAYFRFSDFSNSDLREAELGRAMLMASVFNGADLTKAKLHGTVLHSPIHEGTVVENVATDEYTAGEWW
ncbi:pentapeptide repeat-containing protein [Actinosynnema sp. CA-299493]